METEIKKGGEMSSPLHYQKITPLMTCLL